MAYISTALKKDIVISELVTIHYFEYMKGFVFTGESHDFWEFLYVDKGCVLVRADECTYELNTGDVIFHQPNEFHAIQSTGDKAPNLVAVSFKTDSPEMNFFVKKYFTLTQKERAIISSIISEARNAFDTPLHIPSVEQVIPSDSAPFGSQQLISLYLEFFLITARRNHGEAIHIPVSDSPPPMPIDPQAGARRLNSIVQYMQYHICEQLSIAEICRAFSLSRSALQALFHKEAHCGAMEYFNRMKLELAKELMRDGKMNLTEISYYLSYSSLQYFSKQFKNSTGMSPLEYVSSVKGISQALKESMYPDGKR